jgi:hypothetical protein
VFRCLARVQKLSRAQGEDLKKESWFLGSDLDAYVDAVAGVSDPALRQRHWQICKEALPILVGDTPDNLSAVLKDLEDVSRELMDEEPREETRP